MKRNEFGFLVEVLVNGNPIDGLTISEIHDATVGEVRTVVTGGKIIVKNGDTIQLRFTSKENGEQKKGTYQGTGILTLERVALY